MIRPRVLVTRPEPGASATALLLEELGFAPVVLPLAETRALAVGAVEIEGVAGVVITSAAAVRHAPGELVVALRALPWFAVGGATGRVAVETGAAFVASAAGDAQSLGDMLLRRFGAGERLIYLCGRVRRPELEARLAAAGVRITPVEVYDTLDLLPDVEAVVTPIEAVLVYSARMAAALAEFRKRAPVSAFGGARWIAISRQAAAPLEAEGLAVEVADSPSEAAMLDLLAAAGEKDDARPAT